ncbi:hypothetical protein jhhlp_004925 [Lomentospora prolificans]|uniref:Uncharacterized protein n=1 Tax=Lomentospora prolificans TaxID=41688 RepID=A0A2N3N7W5_9PEZI|nr:hypothetical protein jhhlp_004925 [Lomentospora prolificans]
MSSEQEFVSVPLSSAAQVAAYSLQNPDNPEIELGQASHRIRIINSWEVHPGDRILEIGCGQGNCTAVLAEAVGSSGHVDAIDPAPGDYGAPFTLDQAHEFMSASPIGQRITWHRDEPTEFLAKGTDVWDAAVLLHCIWYFSSPDDLAHILTSLKGRVKRVLVAEYSLRASKATAMPHVLAAIATATVEAHKAESKENIRTLLSPSEIKHIAKEAGWTMTKESYVVPETGLFDGYWEAGGVASASFTREVESIINDPKIAALARSARDATVSAAENIGGLKNITTMDVWLGTFLSD